MVGKEMWGFVTPERPSRKSFETTPPHCTRIPPRPKIPPPLSTFPLTRNGKVDKTVLRSMAERTEVTLRPSPATSRRSQHSALGHLFVGFVVPTLSSALMTPTSTTSLSTWDEAQSGSHTTSRPRRTSPASMPPTCPLSAACIPTTLTLFSTRYKLQHQYSSLNFRKVSHRRFSSGLCLDFVHYRTFANLTVTLRRDTIRCDRHDNGFHHD